MLASETGDYEDYSKHATTFFNWLISQRDLENLEISVTAYTFCLLTLLKKNELAAKYCTLAQFSLIEKMLEGPCTRNA